MASQWGLSPGETGGSESMSPGGPRARPSSQGADITSVTSANRPRKGGRAVGCSLLLPFLQSCEVSWRITTLLPCQRPLSWFYLDFKSKSGIYPSRRIVVSFQICKENNWDSYKVVFTQTDWTSVFAKCSERTLPPQVTDMWHPNSPPCAN